jgi:hypothetical protein
MAIAFHSAQGPGSETLETVIPDYLRAAEAGRVLDASGHRYSAAALRSLQRTLAHVEATLGDVELTQVARADGVGLEALAWRVIDRAGLPPSRLAPTVEALRLLSASGTPQPPAPPPSDPVRDLPARSPTYTMLALGAEVGVWIQRIIVIAFVLTAIGLALEFA